jgi:hypothetical protein
MPSAGPAAAAAPAEAAEEVEKPKEKTIFTVKLEKFDAGAKAKIIREVKAIMPNMNLVEVGLFSLAFTFLRPFTNQAGQEICRVCTPNLEGELAKGGSREIAKDFDGSRSYHLIIVGGRGMHRSSHPGSRPCIVRSFYYSTPVLLFASATYALPFTCPSPL